MDKGCTVTAVKGASIHRHHVMIVGGGLLAAAVAVRGAHAAVCGFEPQGEGRVGAVIDNRTFRLEDGREIRMAGIETVANGNAALAALIAGREVQLRGQNDAPDRWGQQAAFVFSDGSEASVQSELLAQGDALVSTDTSDRSCAAELAAAEARARQAKRGAWADPGVIKNAESAGDILSRIGQFTVVEGKVLSVRQAGATFYANFGQRWTRDFAVSISRRMMTAFEAAGVSPKSFENRRIRVRGFVQQRGGPRIELTSVGQVETIGGN